MTERPGRILVIENGRPKVWATLPVTETGEDGLMGLALDPGFSSSGSDSTWAPAGATFVTRGPWADSFLFTGLRGKALYRVVFGQGDPAKVRSFESYLKGTYGRLRDVAEGPDGGIYVLVSNRDGRGKPGEADDRILRIILQ